MILAIAFAAGAALGWARAARRGGTTADRAQYALAHGFAVTVGTAALALVAGFFGASPL